MAPVNPQKFVGRTKTVQTAATVAPQQQLVASPADSAALQSISKSLTNIIQLLSQQNTQTQREAEDTRKSQERSRRKGIELGLENSFNAVKSVAQSVIAPVKGILDQIIQFFVTLFLGRALVQLLRWFADPNNQGKIRSIMRFLQDWWPSLVAGYILFGTGFGRVVRKVAGVAVGAVARLTVIAARLTKAIATGKGLKGAAAAFSGGGRLGGWKGGLLRLGVGAAATIGTGFAINKAMGGGEESPQLSVPDVPSTPALGAFGGGLANLKDLFSNSTSGLSSKFNPFTSFFGSGGLASVMQGLGGVVSGQKGIDKVPAMLTDGEFVMSRGAVQKFGVNTLEAMNAAGGGTNKPKIVRGIPHAAGGGLIGDNVGSAALRVGTTFGGAPGTQQARWIEGSVSGGNKGSQYSGSAKLGYGSIMSEPSSPQTVTDVALNNLVAGAVKASEKWQGIPYALPPQELKSEQKTGLFGDINFSMSKSLGQPKKPQPPEPQPPQKPPVKTTGPKTPPPPLKGEMQFANAIQSAIYRLQTQGLVDAGGNPYTGISPSSPNLTAQQKQDLMLAQVGLNNRLMSRPNTVLSPNSTQKLVTYNSKVFQAYMTAPAWASYNKGGAVLPRNMGGQVPVKLTRGEGIISPNNANKIGYQNLNLINQMKVVPGEGPNVDTVQDRLSPGSFVLQRPAVEMLSSKKAKLGRTSPNVRPITPVPKPAPRVVSSGSRPTSAGGYGGMSGVSAKPSVPKFSASGKSSRREKNIYGIK
jgi:hypothetical protein